eukprot:1134341-Pelagomonas_calceolata.AAC.1
MESNNSTARQLKVGSGTCDLEPGAAKSWGLKSKVTMPRPMPAYPARRQAAGNEDPTILKGLLRSGKRAGTLSVKGCGVHSAAGLAVVRFASLCNLKPLSTCCQHSLGRTGAQVPTQDE